MLISVAASFWDDALDPLKVSFDGDNKLIIVNPQYDTLDVKIDIYSAWKRWLLRRQNTQYEPALRTIGGDPVGGGLYAGDMYFLTNNWQVVINHTVAITGILYQDNPALKTYIINAGGGVTSTVSSLAYAYNISGTTAPTIQEIRTEIDTNSTQLAAIKAQTNTIPLLATAVKQDEIIDSIGRISISTSSINAPAIAFNATSGVVTTGTYDDTKNLNGIYHVIADNALVLDIDYLFDIGLNAAPATLTFVGKVDDKQEQVIVHAWNYVSSSWDVIGNIQGSNPGASLYNVNFTLYASHTGTEPGFIGDVRIRFTSASLSDVILTIDMMYVSYAIIPSTLGFSGHAVSATSTTIQLNANASTIDDYYVPSLLTVNHGTGSHQFAKVVGYTGATKTLQLELPMATILDTTSHISLLPWANATVENIPEITQAIRTELTPELTHILLMENGLTATQATMLTEIYYLYGLDPTKPLVVTDTNRSAGVGIQQTISSGASVTTVTRV